MKDALRSVPGAAALWRTIGHLRHAVVQRFGRRRNYTFTQFCRLPTQTEQLAGPVLDAASEQAKQGPVRIFLFGCSIGAEPYSLASSIMHRRPDTPFLIRCFDIQPEMVARVRAATYRNEELTRRGGLPPGFLDRTFDRRDDRVTVKPELRGRVQAEVGDVLDETLMAALGNANLVIGQNFLYHLSRRDAARALRNLTGLVAPRGALAIDGTDLDLRSRYTAEAGLDPWPQEIERIHEEARDERGYAWPGIYWGLEPYEPGRRDAVRRYATIFLKR